MGVIAREQSGISGMQFLTGTNGSFYWPDGVRSVLQTAVCYSNVFCDWIWRILLCIFRPRCFACDCVGSSVSLFALLLAVHRTNASPTLSGIVSSFLEEALPYNIPDLLPDCMGNWRPCQILCTRFYSTKHADKF